MAIDTTNLTSPSWARPIVVGILIASCGGCARQMGATMIPPDAMTASNLTVLEQRIRSYHSRHGTLPPDLNSLPLQPEKSNDLSDGWDRPIEFTRESDSLCYIRSLGADGEIGGTGDNSDVIRSINVELPHE